MNSNDFFSQVSEELKELYAQIDLTPIEKLAFLILQSGAFALSNGHIEAFRFSVACCANMLRQFEPEAFDGEEQFLKIADRDARETKLTLFYLQAIAKILSKKVLQVDVKLTEEEVKMLLKGVKITSDKTNIEI